MKNLKDILPLANIGDELILFSFGERPTDDLDFKCHFAHLGKGEITEQYYHRMLKFSPYNEDINEDQMKYLRDQIYRKIPNEILIELFLNN